jgi:hypothetical protein
VKPRSVYVRAYVNFTFNLLRYNPRIFPPFLFSYERERVSTLLSYHHRSPPLMNSTWSNADKVRAYARVVGIASDATSCDDIILDR